MDKMFTYILILFIMIVLLSRKFEIIKNVNLNIQYVYLLEVAYQNLMFFLNFRN